MKISIFKTRSDPVIIIVKLEVVWREKALKEHEGNWLLCCEECHWPFCWPKCKTLLCQLKMSKTMDSTILNIFQNDGSKYRYSYGSVVCCLVERHLMMMMMIECHGGLISPTFYQHQLEPNQFAKLPSNKRQAKGWNCKWKAFFSKWKWANG